MCEGPHPFIPAAGTVKVELVFSGAGGSMENVYHVRPNAAITEALLDQIVTLFDGWDDVDGSEHRSASVSLDRIVAKDVSVDDGLGVEFALPAPRPGVVTGSPVLPNNVTAAVKWTTGFTGRSRRGRTYIVGLYEGGVIGDQLESATRAALLADYQALLTAVTGEGWDLVVVSYCANGDWRTNALVTPISSASIEGTVDSQRRRLLGRGQ